MKDSYQYICKLLSENVTENKSLISKEVKKIKEGIYSHDTKDVVFITPPYWDVYTPFSAVPSLIGELNKHSIHSAQIDLGIMCFHIAFEMQKKSKVDKFFTHEYFMKYVEPLNKKIDFTYEQYCESIQFLRKEDLSIEYIKKHYKGYTIVQKGVIDYLFSDMIDESAVYVDFNNHVHISDWIKKVDSQFVLNAIYEYDCMPYLIGETPILGISITSIGQFAFGCYLAYLIKIVNPDAIILGGGSCFELYYESDYQFKDEIFDYFDYICIGEGETWIRELSKNILSETLDDDVLSEIPNMVYKNQNGDMIRTESLIEDVNILGIPDYTGLDLDLYLAPETILPYQTSRGCFYGNCSFCNHSESYRHNYRTKEISNVVKEIIEMSIKYNVKNFQFVDEAIRFDCFVELVHEMEKYPIFKEIKWMYYSRVHIKYDDEIIMKAKNNGCEMVFFGVETLNQRLLNFIKKGALASVAKDNLKKFHRNGVKTYIWLMCNLPSETVEEVRQDIIDIEDNIENISCLCPGIFELCKNTDMWNSLEDFNIIEVDDEDGRRFVSTNEGVIIDNDEMFRVFNQEYKRLIIDHYFTVNRYAVYFSE